MKRENFPVNGRLLGGGTPGVGDGPDAEAVGVRTGIVAKEVLVRIGGVMVSSHCVVPLITE